MSLIAIDLGTSFIKGAVIDLDSLSLSHIQRLPYPGPVAGLPPLFHEVDPRTVVQTTRDLIGALLAHAPACEGLVICSQMHGLVLTDDRAEPLSNHISWQDQRILQPHPSGAETYFDALLEQVSPTEQRQLGRELQVSRPLCFLYWLAQNEQLPDDAIPSSLPDFVLAHLCKRAPTTEATNAGAHGALNLETGDWHYALIEHLGLERLQWPRVLPFGEVVGTLHIDGQSLPCYTPVGDHQCALVGAFLRTGELSLNIATGSQVSMVTSDLILGDYQTRPYFDGQFLNTITGVPAGRALTHLVNLLCAVGRGQGHALDDAWAYIIEAAEQVEASDLDVNLAFFDSLSGASGHIANIREDNLTVGHIFHAAFQSMADSYYVSARRLDPALTGRSLVFSGGLAQKIGLLRRLILERFQVACRVCVSEEDALLGLMTLGLAAGRRASSVTAAIEIVQARY